MKKYAIIDRTDMTVSNVVGEGAGILATVAAGDAIVLNALEWCQPGAKFRPGQTPRFVNVDAKTWTAYEFLNRFTKQERKSIRTKAKTDDEVDDFQMLAMSANEIVSDDPTTVTGMDYLVSVGVITSQRKTEILGA